MMTPSGRSEVLQCLEDHQVEGALKMDDSESGMPPLGCIKDRSGLSCGMSRGGILSGLTIAYPVERS